MSDSWQYLPECLSYQTSPTFIVMRSTKKSKRESWLKPNHWLKLYKMGNASISTPATMMPVKLREGQVDVIWKIRLIIYSAVAFLFGKLLQEPVGPK